MITIPTRSRLERRRDRLYKHLQAIIHIASVQKVENVMRQIHSINLRLRTYYKATDRQAQELFINPEEDNDITAKSTTACEVPTEQELARIEAQVKAGEI